MSTIKERTDGATTELTTAFFSRECLMMDASIHSRVQALDHETTDSGQNNACSHLIQFIISVLLIQYEGYTNGRPPARPYATISLWKSSQTVIPSRPPTADPGTRNPSARTRPGATRDPASRVLSLVR
jgi:hypothetical protein